ncbi:hypothetical protein F2P81_017293 [Scophthalmus maximus]|uniref:Uncharacterized protein n=1 Tax=Scophthalmus maximus TaxID=52904 RepID=A0A6A4SJM5_SCOMX|nr:hypothetical protein F2P81_017293 [Scophthalmus maximus]
MCSSRPLEIAIFVFKNSSRAGKLERQSRRLNLCHVTSFAGTSGASKAPEANRWDLSGDNLCTSLPRHLKGIVVGTDVSNTRGCGVRGPAQLVKNNVCTMEAAMHRRVGSGLKKKMKEEHG